MLRDHNSPPSFKQLLKSLYSNCLFSTINLSIAIDIDETLITRIEFLQYTVHNSDIQSP